MSDVYSTNVDFDSELKLVHLLQIDMALHIAVACGDIDIVQSIMEEGADVNRPIGTIHCEAFTSEIVGREWSYAEKLFEVPTVQ